LDYRVDFAALQRGCNLGQSGIKKKRFEPKSAPQVCNKKRWDGSTAPSVLITGDLAA
jgi:hypothetical protein